MPKRVPADAIHTTAVDHKITRVPKFVKITTEDHKPYTGRVVPYYTSADKLSLALANIGPTTPGAIELYWRHLQRDPLDIGTLLALGKSYLRQNVAADAIPTLRKALQLEPMNSDARAHLGVAFAVTGRTAEALEQLRRAVADNPDHALSWINLGVTLAATGDGTAALAAFSEAIRLQPDSLEARHRRSLLEASK
jgi:tetratricopeptide (TPR) repeat protein